MLFLIILILCLILQFFLPWWIIAPIAFGISIWKSNSGKHAFGSGFSAVFFLWIIIGLIKTLPNDNLLANRVAQMMMLPDASFNWIILLIITGLIGGITSGFCALAGFYLRRALVDPKI